MFSKRLHFKNLNFKYCKNDNISESMALILNYSIYQELWGLQ